MASTPMEANAVRKALSAGFNMAEVWGWRRDGGEILGLRWQDVDVERRCLRLPDSKTGA
jgi:integrase